MDLKNIIHIGYLGMVLGGGLMGCNGHPVEPLEETLVVTQRQVFHLPARPAVDFLFIIDSSPSMREEQVALARNVAEFAGFFVGARSAFDFRIAVTTPDLAVAQPGAFAHTAAADPPAYEPPAAIDLADCRALEAEGALGPVLDPDAIEAACAASEADDACLQAELSRRFTCLAVRGTDGDPYEKGLEAMRQALSCAGPNAGLWSACCTPEGYDPACRPAVPPDFLRPHAKLVVVIVSDEDDCSDQPGAHLAEGGLNGCIWQRDQLVPVADYVRFLQGLKADPQHDLVVATVVGHDILTAEGVPPTYAPGPELEGCDPNHPTQSLEVCCPGGVCTGGARVVCEATGARAGTRYLELAEAFGRAGLGCPAGAEGTEACLSVCAEDFAAPVQQILTAAQQVRFCLDPRPACTVGDRPCSSLELGQPGHYALQVTVGCTDAESAAAGSGCAGGPRRRLAAEAFQFDPLASDCGSAAAITLAVPPPAGGAVWVDYRVETP